MPSIPKSPEGWEYSEKDWAEYCSEMDTVLLEHDKEMEMILCQKNVMS